MLKLWGMKQVLALLVFMCSACHAAAQVPSTYISETEEQYARSQTARENAVNAFRAGDIAVALEGMKKALSDRPTNIAVLGNAIFLAAEMGAVDEMKTLTHRYLALGVVPPAGIVAALKEKLPAAVWSELKTEIDRLNAPSGSAETLYTVPVRYRLVEGIASDGKGGFFLSTVVSGSIHHLKNTGEIQLVLDGKVHDAPSFFGIAFNPDEDRLYATYGRVEQTPNVPAGAGKTGVLRINATTGSITGNWPLPGGTDGQQIADIAINASGAVVVSEGQGSGLYLVEASGLRRLETGVTFRSPQGLAFLPDGTLLMADYGRGLWKIDLEAEAATLLGVPQSVSLIGIDGLFAHKGHLAAIQNGVSPHRIIEISVDNARENVTGITVLAQNLDGFDEPTLGTSTAAGIAFVASSQWPKFGDGGALRDGQTYQPTNIMMIRD